MDTVSERLGELIKTLGYNPTSFSKELGYTNNNVTIGRILQDTSKMPSAETMLKISERFVEVNLDWILTGKGEMLKNANTTGNISGNARVVQQSVSGYIGGNVEAHNHHDEGKDEVIKNKQEQVKNMFLILRSELNKFYEKMDKKDAYIEKLISDNAAQNSIQNENNLNQMKEFLQAAERKHEGSMRRVEENAKRIDELIGIIIRQDEKIQERADKLVDILEKKL